MTFKKRKTVLIKTTAFLSATVFWGQDGCPLTYCGEGKIMALEGDEFGKARSIFLPLPNLPVHRKGEVLDRLPEC